MKFCKSFWTFFLLQFLWGNQYWRKSFTCIVSFIVIMKHSQYDRIHQYFQKSLESGSQIPQFFILEGIQHLGQDSELIRLLHWFLWDYVVSDFLWVKDFSGQLWKKHAIKIDTMTTSTTYKELYNEYNYIDIGVRDINTWLQQSSFSGKKIILIENIERMTTSAINAFLKTAEEPMAGKLIVATTKNKSLLLDTVLSRALVFPVSEQLSHEAMFTKMEQWSFFVQHQELKEVVFILSLGIWHRVEQFVVFLDQHPDTIHYFKNIDTNFLSGKDLYLKHIFLKQLADFWIIIYFVEGVTAYYVEKGNWEIANRWLLVKKLLTGNVNTNQILFYALVQLTA